MVLQDEIHSHPEHAHDAHVVERHAHVLGIVQGGNLHLACFPSQKGTKKLQRSKKGGHNSNDDVESLVLFLLLLLLLSSHSTIFRDPFEARHILSQQKKILRIILLLLSLLWLCLMTEITSQSQRKKVFIRKQGEQRRRRGEALPVSKKILRRIFRKKGKKLLWKDESFDPVSRLDDISNPKPLKETPKLTIRRPL